MSQLTQRLFMASGGKKDSTYVDDVFSTYLYEGTGSALKVNNGLKLGNANAGDSVYFGGFGESSDYLQMAHTTDLCFGNGDFTIECWAYAAKHDSWNAIIGNWNNGNPADGYALETVSGDLEFYWYNAAGSYTLVQGAAVPVGEWSHLCVCRSGNTIRVFVNGTMYGSGVSMTEGIRDGTTDFSIGGRVAAGGWWDGNITNLRVTKGQALYTANFTPSTDPFTTTSQGATASNVKLLCCNKDTVTGSDVTPGTITAFGTPTASKFGIGTATDGKGGMVWAKSRSNGDSYWIVDTVRGLDKSLKSNTDGNNNTASGQISSFNNTGFTLGNNNQGQNYSGFNYGSWSFAKQQGFFDIVTWSGNNTPGRTIPHNLGSIPGCIMVKRTDTADSWQVYHRGNVTGDQNAAHYWLNLDQTASRTNNNTRWNNAEPTASVFTVGSNSGVNVSGGEYVAYLFAGGASDQAGAARSVEFSNSGYLDIADHSDFTFGTDDFTIECWYKADDLNLSNNWDYIFSSGWPVQLGHTVDSANTNSRFSFYFADSNSTSSYLVSNLNTGNGSVSAGQWYHVAVTRSGSTFRIFLNGELKDTATSSGSAPAPNANSAIGRFTPSSPYYYADGQISNFRYVKGTAVYTETFIPPTKPLTAITNTKLLCCNKNTVTGSDVTPGTITSHNNTQSITDTPFDDLAGFKFGEGGDANIIKTGSFRGAGSVAVDVNIGWEPSWVLIRNAEATEDWFMFDNMRGVVSGGNDMRFQPNNNGSEFTTFDYIDFTSTGFKVNANATAGVNGSGNIMLYVAIRRPDGYVGKPAEVGSDVFTVVNSATDSGSPWMRTTHIVDYQFFKLRAGTDNWWTSSRLTQGNYLYANTTAASAANQYQMFDYMDGYNSGTDTSGNYTGWLWKRHAGFDVVTDKGNGQTTKTIPHGLGVVPEMIWRKNRDGGSDNWQVYHVGLNGGTNPHLWRIYLNTTNTQSEDQWTWDSAPTATHFTVGSNGAVNRNNEDFITMLFASVDGISKVGYYTGNGSTQSITDVGFTPRFLIIKPATQTYGWFVVDSLRGWPVSGSGQDDKVLYLDSNVAQAQWNVAIRTATGFDLPQDGGVNGNNEKYIYYAHA